MMTQDKTPKEPLIHGQYNPDELEPEPVRKQYWAALTLDSPFSYITVGGRSLSKWRGKFQSDSTSGASLIPRGGRGCFFTCSEAEFEVVREHLEAKVFRRHPTRGAQQISTLGRRRRADPETGEVLTERPYKRAKDDFPAGWFVVLLEVAKRQEPEWATDEPELRKRTYFERPRDVLGVDLFPPEPTGAPDGLHESSEGALDASARQQSAVVKKWSRAGSQ